MRTLDLFTTAVANTFRSKTRLTLTTLAILIGAFTLTLTSGLGTGINAYIDSTVTSIGAADMMTVTKPSEAETTFMGADSGPVEYDPDVISNGQDGPRGTSVIVLTPDDITTLSNIDGVLDVEPSQSISPDWIEATATPSTGKYVTAVGTLVTGQTLQLAAGANPDNTATELQLVLPVTYVTPLGFSDNDAAIGQSVTIGISDAERTSHEVSATVVGVTEESIASPTGAGIVPNTALTDTLFATQNIGIPLDQQDRYAQASIRFASDATDDQISELKERLVDAGYSGMTVADQLGTFTAIIDAIVLVLNAFAIIALLAASFGIVNTLFMSVQERTREIGLMKAMGMGSGRVFGLFSLEAVFIGFLGSAIGVAIAMAAGTALSAALSTKVLSGLPGLTLIAFDATSIITIILGVMVIAFLAGTLPAARAARADPVESLRYE